jgi:hypothetical protein
MLRWIKSIQQRLRNSTCLRLCSHSGARYSHTGTAGSVASQAAPSCYSSPAERGERRGRFRGPAPQHISLSPPRPRSLPGCGCIPGTRKVSEKSERSPLGNGGRPWQGMSLTPRISGLPTVRPPRHALGTRVALLNGEEG